MSGCRVIMTKMNNSEKRCRNYAMTNLSCCYSHRKLEIENQEELVHNLVNDIVKRIIYNVRIDYIREHGWDKYCEKLRNKQI